MNLTINTSVDFVRERTERTRAVQVSLAEDGGWVWYKRTVPQWDAALLQLDGAQVGTLAQVAKVKQAAYLNKRGELEARMAAIHGKTLQAVGVMRSRALTDASVRDGVEELSARGDSARAIEDEGEQLLVTWEAEFGTAFEPVPGLTHAGFAALFNGAAGPPVVVSLIALRAEYKAARSAMRKAVGKYNALINTLWEDCVSWYGEATSVFAEGTDEGDLIRSEVPTIYNPGSGPNGGGSSSSSSSSSSGGGVLPTAPQNGSVGSGSSGSGAVTFTWETVAGATSYRVYRDGSLVATVTVPVAELDGFTPGESVTLTVSAVNAAGEGPASEAVTGTAG